MATVGVKGLGLRVVERENLFAMSVKTKTSTNSNNNRLAESNNHHGWPHVIIMNNSD